METWKPVSGFEDIYEISNYGQVKSVGRTVVVTRYGKPYARDQQEIVLQAFPDKKGYLRLVLSNGGRKGTSDCKYRSVKVHRLVAEHFIENPDNLPMVNHIDGNKQNNHVSNLEWCTNAHNVQHAVKTGLLVRSKGIHVHNAVLNDTIVSDMLRMKHVLGKRNVEIIDYFKLPKGTVTSILNRRNWKHVPIPAN